MKFLEKDLEEVIFKSNASELLKKGGLFIGLKKKRQVTIGNYGRCDIMGFHREGHYDHLCDHAPFDPWQIRNVFTICEIKQDSISISAFLQSLKYARGLSHYLRKYRPGIFCSHRIDIVLIGKRVDIDSSFVYLPEYLNGIVTLKIYTYDFCLSGITFKEHVNYYLSNPGF